MYSPNIALSRTASFTLKRSELCWHKISRKSFLSNLSLESLYTKTQIEHMPDRPYSIIKLSRQCECDDFKKSADSFTTVMGEHKAHL